MYNGEVKVAVAPTIPVPNVDMLLGSDKVGDKVFPLSVVSTKPIFLPIEGSLDKSLESIITTCAGSRSMKLASLYEGQLARPPSCEPVEVDEDGEGWDSDVGPPPGSDSFDDKDVEEVGQTRTHDTPVGDLIVSPTGTASTSMASS